MQTVHVIRYAALLGLLSAMTGCTSQSATSRPAAHEASVKPGINDPYKHPNVQEWIDKFEGESREIFREREKIIAALDLKPGIKMADIGAGTGLFEPYFAAGVGESGHVYAVDLVPEFLNLIQKRAAERGLKNIETVQCREDSVELPAGSVDLVFICDAYHHFEFPKSTLASIHKALRPGGGLIVVDFVREEGVTRQWVLDHVRAGRNVVTQEITSAGFVFDGEVKIEGMTENYFLGFTRR